MNAGVLTLKTSMQGLINCEENPLKMVLNEERKKH